jgi:hypothetical protein
MSASKHKADQRTKAHQSSKSSPLKQPPDGSRDGEVPPTAIASDEENTEARPKRPVTFAKVLFGVFVAATLAGYLSGKIASPSYDNPAKAMKPILEYADRSSSIQLPQWQIDRSANGAVTGLRLQGGVVQLTCGFHRILHHLNGNPVSDEEYRKKVADYVAAREKKQTSKRVTKSSQNIDDPIEQAQRSTEMLFGPSFSDLEATFCELPAVEPPNQAGTPREGASLPEVIGVMRGGAEAYSLKYASGQVSSYFREVEGISRGKRIVRGLQLVGAGLSGFAIGFYLGYSDDPNCGNQKLAEQLNQTSLWKNVGLDLQQFYTWRFQRDPALAKINKIETLGARRLTLRDAWVGVHSAIESKNLGLHRTDFVVSKQVKDDLTSNTSAREPLEYLPLWLNFANLLGDRLSKRFNDSNFERQMMRMRIEQFLWVKQGKDDWLPTEDTMVEITIEEAYSDSTIPSTKARCYKRRRTWTWNSLGRFVKRGEKGIFILAPMVGKRSTKDVATDEPSEDATTEGQRTLYGFRAVYVFDRLSRDLWPSLCASDGSRLSHFRKFPR